MYHIYPDKSYKKKVRGQIRKFKNMENNIIESTSEFPEIDLDYGYWHLHIPISQRFIDSYKTPVALRRKCIQLIIDRVEFLINNKLQSDIDTRVVACINLPSLWDSQIIVFFGDEYYKNFFNRNTEYQKWIPFSKERNIFKEWDLNFPSSMKVKGYKEEINEEDLSFEGELWFIGEIDAKWGCRTNN